MDILGIPILSFLIFFPLAGAIILLFIKKEETIRWTTLAIALVEFVVSLPLFFNFDSDTAAMQFVEDWWWVEAYGISYKLGIDGISLLLVLLTTFLTVLCILSSWTAITFRVKEYMISFLFLETGMIGALVALDLILFYVFWEVMLIPMYLLIGIWGDPQRRIYAAVKFFLFTMAGSVLMLVAILVLYFINLKATGRSTFDVLELYKPAIPVATQYWLFGAFALAFAIKVPMFPFHTWLPDAHTEAPTAGSVILAGVLLKMGTYGFIRFAIPLFPKAAFDLMPLISVLALIGIIYGALVSMMQPDLKRLVAFSSVSHLGYVMLGMFALNMQGVQGSIYQMLNHGISTGSLFLIVGMIYERRHTRLIADFGGLSKVMPVFARLLHDRHPLLHRASRDERVCGRVSDPPRGLSGQYRLWCPGCGGSHPGRGLHALDVPEGDVRKDDQTGERKAEGPQCTGDHHPHSHGDPDLRHGDLSQTLLQQDGCDAWRNS